MGRTARKVDSDQLSRRRRPGSRVWRKLLILSAGLVGFCPFPPSVLGASKVPLTDKQSGAQIYHNYCSVCHGDRGDGNSRAKGSFVRPPRDFTAPDAKNLSKDYMVAITRDGKTGTAMVGWKTQLDDKQIAAVVDYVRSAFMGISVPPASGGPAAGADPLTRSMAQPLPQGLKGNPAKGAAFYMANCATCHGASGDGNGPRAYFINPKPRNFLYVSSRLTLNRPVLFNAIALGKPGTEMPAWNKVLSNQEIADVAEFIFQTFIRPEEKEKRPASGK